jgi:hypothetical protein
MKLKINYLPEKYEDIILPLMTINPKLTLGGSLALHLLNIMDYDFTNRKPDLDFSLLEPLTEEELLSIKDFFDLSFIIKNNDYEIETVQVDDELSRSFSKIKNTSHFLTKNIIQLYKPDLTAKPDNTEHWDKEYVIDFFNKEYLPAKEMIKIQYKDFELRLTHPSVILSHKSKYAYDNRVGKQYKHFQDLQKIDWKNYFQIIKRFQAVWVPIPDSPNYQKISHYEYYDNNKVEIDLPF